MSLHGACDPAGGGGGRGRSGLGPCQGKAGPGASPAPAGATCSTWCSSTRRPPSNGWSGGLEGNYLISVVLDEDPGAPASARCARPGIAFSAPEELEVLPDDGRARPPATASILVAGIGNIFLGDDAFGVEVAQRLAARALPDGVPGGRLRHPRDSTWPMH